nr:hypothetical protein [Tanacetum cinerariifolium]
KWHQKEPPAITTTTTSVIDAQLKALIDQGVADELAACDADRSRNGEDNHDSGTGARRQAPPARECTYQEFMKCKTLYFKGTEGVVELTHALTWWNSHVKNVGPDVAYAMTWTNLKKKMSDKYCPRGEIKKLEVELWNLKVKESDKIERNIGGLPDMIHESVMTSKPKTMQDIIEFTTELMDKKIITFDERVKGPTSGIRARFTLKDVAVVGKTAEIEENDDELEPAELKEVVEVVTTAKLMTKVVTAAATITAATILITDATISAAPSAARRRKGVDDVIEQVQRKDKEDNDVIRYQALKRKLQIEAQARKNMMIYLRNIAGFKMDYFKGMSYDDLRSIFENYFNSNVAFLEKSKEQLEEEESRALKRKSESSEEKATNKQKLNEEVEELKKHLQIVPNNNDDVYTEATPFSLKVPVVDYEIYTKNNKPYFKIIRADGTHQLFLSFLSLLENLDREDLEPDVEAQVWKSQKGVYGLAKVKSWRLLESCGVYVITLTTTQMILLVERRYPLTRFTLNQMLNNVRLKVEEESKVSLELLRFVRQQQQEGFRPE